jgi:hypothetical protein
VVMRACSDSHASSALGLMGQPVVLSESRRILPRKVEQRTAMTREQSERRASMAAA